jgi:hypothetical protein
MINQRHAVEPGEAGLFAQSDLIVIQARIKD